MKRNPTWLMLVFCLLAGGLLADVAATITKAGSGEKIQGAVRWQPASGVYLVTPTGQPIQLRLSPRDVADIRVTQPAELAPAVAQVQRGDYAGAIPVLSKVMEDYTMLEWDAVAARWLAEAYIQTKEPKKAADVCDKVVSQNPKAALSPDMAPNYWKALLETEQYPKLRTALTEAAAQGNRDLAALAQVLRGDIDRKQGKLKEAIVDGYLRTVYLFQDVKSVQPEALYKATKCFEELGQNSYADKMRKRLLADYPQDPYAEKIKTGG